ncbi:apolipoprotein N-acyltransferase [uncultured Sphingomonas sp.]|uniref:apolipoprotein N-acyltransferase n=1 Tax=uncultured Sphingomonas sp. TaxID=158754 RepID=UPI0035CC7865
MRRLAPLYPLALGALAATGFAPFGWWPMTLVCCALWLVAVHRAATPRRMLLIGWLFGVGHFGVANIWIRQAFDFQDAMPHWLGYLAVLLLAMYLAIYPMLAAGLAWRLARPAARGAPVAALDGAFVCVAGAGWIATEWLRGTMFTGYPWDPLSVIWVPDVARVARLTGTYALSGLTIVASGMLAMLVAGRWRMPLGGAAIGGALFIAAYAPSPPSPPAGGPLLRVVQPDLAEEERPTPDYPENNFQALARWSGRPPGRPRLIVWPEGALRYPVEDGYPRYIYREMGNATAARARIAFLLGDRDLVLTGAQPMYFGRGGDLVAATNAIVAIGPDARLHGRYDKAHLVPYGEYLPLRRLLEAIGLSRLVPGDIDFIPGPGPRSLDLPGFGRIGMLVCYEVIFSGAVVGPGTRPRLLFNPSNDAWFGEIGPLQHLRQARLRAIEEGLPIVRATPTGISAVIGADGGLIAALPPHVAGAIEVPFPRPLPPTPFALWGNAVAALIAGLLMINAIAIRRLDR